MAEEAQIERLKAELARLKKENEKLKASNRRWMRIAGTDELTGLPNKVFFTTALLPQIISKASADGQPIACIMLAPDKLGDINARFGRQGGDEIVKGMSEFLKENIDASEKLVHIDGANFAILIANGDLTAAKRRALTLRARVLSRRFPVGDDAVSLTLSMGTVARAPTPEGQQINTKEVIEEMLRKVAAALDQAKKKGGDSHVEDPEVNF